MCLQLTPDGQRLILLGNVKTPYCRFIWGIICAITLRDRCQVTELIQGSFACRERKISCPCSTCASVSSDDNAVRIVQVNVGYVTVVVSLKTVDRILSILVCEPNYIVATGESGRLHSWIMDSKWRYACQESI